MGEILNAVEVYDADYFCGSKHILKGLNMAASRGTVYGLLGPSGCGKTTLLKCIMGLRELSSGKIKVFGFRPKMSGSGIPGHNVGFMPQDTALLMEMTPSENLIYFGLLLGITASALTKRMDYLFKLLFDHVPTEIVSQLSGGQQRRVSLGVALLGQPPLLILDEPTVGADPKLRHKIWEHLLFLAKEFQTTIIVTTHYIEEARKAQKVGLMRHGVMLVEDNPECLMEQYKLPSLEQIFLKLTMETKQITKIKESARSTGSNFFRRLNMVIKTITSKKNNPLESAHVKYKTLNDKRRLKPDNKKIFKSADNNIPTYDHVNAILKRTVFEIKRNYNSLITQMVCPALIMIIWCVCVGNLPTDIKVATFYDNVTYAEEPGNLGGLYIQTIRRKHLNVIPYPSPEAAYEAVVDGIVTASVTIVGNFTDDFMWVLCLEDKGNKYRQGFINVSIDNTIKLTALVVEEQLYLSFLDLKKIITDQLNVSHLHAELPVLFNSTIYGTPEPEWKTFPTIGLLVCITLLMASSLIGIQLYTEITTGILDRDNAAGMGTLQYLFTLGLIQSLTLVVQILLSLFVVFYVFESYNVGSLTLLFFLLLLQGLLGMALGVILGMLSGDIALTVMISVAALFTSLLVSGAAWPLEGMPESVRMLTNLSPQTRALSAARSITGRGWDLSYTQVQLGYLTTIVWFIGCLLFTKLLAKQFAKVDYNMKNFVSIIYDVIFN